MSIMQSLWSDPTFLELIQKDSVIGNEHGDANEPSPQEMDENESGTGEEVDAADESSEPILPVEALNASPDDTAGSRPAPRQRSSGQAMPDTKLLDELDRLEKELARLRKQFAPGGISKAEQAKLDALQARIDGIIKQLSAQGEIIGVSGAGKPPRRPSDVDGEIQYEGLPLDKLGNEQQRNVARGNAKKVRDGIKSMDAWATKLDERSREHYEKQTRYDMVIAHSEDVNAAFANDLKGGGIKKLSKAVGPLFEQNLANYEQAAADVSISLSDLKQQAYRIAAAKAMVEQAESLLETYNQEKARDAEGKKLAELKQKMEDLKSGVNFVIDAVKDPKGTIDDLKKKAGLKIREAFVDEIVDGLLGGEKLKSEMAQIERRIAAINQRLEALKLTGLNAGVNQAMNTVNAEMEKTTRAQIALKKAKQAQGQAVDILATMERNNPNTTTVFGKMQHYYAEVQQAGSEAMQESKKYETDLEGVQGAMSHTAELRQTVQQDRAVLGKLYPLGSADPDEMAARDKMNAIVDYTKQMDDWYKAKGVESQIQEQKQLQSDLRGNKQFAYIGKMINAVQEQGLGHVQRDGQIAE